MSLVVIKFIGGAICCWSGDRLCTADIETKLFLKAFMRKVAFWGGGWAAAVVFGFSSLNWSRSSYVSSLQNASWKDSVLSVRLEGESSLFKLLSGVHGEASRPSNGGRKGDPNQFSSGWIGPIGSPREKSSMTL